MTEYFSVDRRGRYKAGEALGLYQGQDPQGAPYLSESEGVKITPADLAAHLKALFPSGLSLHGWDYMTASYRTKRPLLVQDSGGPVRVDYSLQLELFVEYVRRAEFRRRPSRLQCYFACGSLAEAEKFRSEQQNGSALKIYRLTAKKVLRLDQAWLRLGHQNAMSSYAAHQYWSGAAGNPTRWEYVMATPVHVVEQVA